MSIQGGLTALSISCICDADREQRVQPQCMAEHTDYSVRNNLSWQILGSYFWSWNACKHIKILAPALIIQNHLMSVLCKHVLLHMDYPQIIRCDLHSGVQNSQTAKWPVNHTALFSLHFFGLKKGNSSLEQGSEEKTSVKDHGTFCFSMRLSMASDCEGKVQIQKYFHPFLTKGLGKAYIWLMGWLENFAFHILLMVSKSNRTCIHEGDPLCSWVSLFLPFTSTNCFQIGGLATAIKRLAVACSPLCNTAPTHSPALLLSIRLF